MAEQLLGDPRIDEADDGFEIGDELDDAETRDIESDYLPDPRVLWGSEAARAIMIVLTRRLGPDFARDVSDELASRTFSYEAGCPDDRRDGAVMERLLNDKFWDALFAMERRAE